jgi:hypothetical protein
MFLNSIRRLKIADLRAKDFSIQGLLSFGQDFMENLVDEAFLTVQSNETQLGSLPFVLEIELGDRDIISFLEPVLERIQDFSFFLERVGIRQEDLESK